MSDLDQIKSVIDERMGAVDALQKGLAQQKEDIAKQGVVHTETKSLLEKANAAISELGEAKADAEKRIAAVEAAMRAGADAAAGVSKGANEVAEYKSQLELYCRRGGNEALVMEAARKASEACPEFKTMAVNSEPDGGYLVTPDMSGRIADVVHETSVMRSRASVQSISTDSLSGSVQEGRSTAGWVGETQPRTDTATAQLGMWSITAHEMYARPEITQKLLDDAAVNVEQWLANNVAQEFGLLEESAFYVGDGIAKPRGIITYAKDYATNSGVVTRGNVRTVKSGSISSLGAAENIVNLVYRVKAQDRANGVFQGTREAFEQIRLMTQDDKFTWQPGLQAGEPDRIMGYAFDECNDLQAIADGAVPLIFGDINKAYQIVDRTGVRTIRDNITKPGFVIFNTNRRVGGDVIVFDCFAQLSTEV